jgi:hypothetical protein
MMNDLIRKIQLRSPHDALSWMKGRNIIQMTGTHEIQRMGSFLIITVISIVGLWAWIFSYAITGSNLQTQRRGDSDGSSSAYGSLGTNGTVVPESISAVLGAPISSVPPVLFPVLYISMLVQCVMTLTVREGAMANRKAMKQALHWGKILGEMSQHEFSLSCQGSDLRGSAAAAGTRSEGKNEIRQRRRKLSNSNSVVAVGLPKTLARLRSIENSVRAVIQQLELYDSLKEIRLATVPLSWKLFHQFVGVVFSELFFLGTILFGLVF